ncbi:MAG TPA: long-chain fatty acid--CoA ligase [Vicinamibacterales bacterium]|nr:long-chain fatty acid--CoA ligase [Vicinamibacterales bacterium]
MMPFQLTLTSLLERAGRLFPAATIVSQRPDNSTHRYTYADFYHRARALAAMLQRLGLRQGDRVATLMWNHHRHLEAYFAVPAIGGVLHTLNLRLHPDELAYIVNHAEDRFLLVDDVLLPVFDRIKDLVRLEHVIVAPCSGGSDAHGYEDYEAQLATCDADPVYPEITEDDPAGMCYTSGTTGQPKGVVYTHRSISLHALSISLPDHFAISRRDTILPAMSMFHATAWGMPFAGVMNGSAFVLPGPNLQPERILDLLSTHRVTLTGAVPTVWLAVLNALEREPDRWRLEPGLRIVVGGSAAPEALVRRFEPFGARVLQVWGLTETSPIATVSTLKPHMESWPEVERFKVRATQGVPGPFTEIRSVDERGEVAWDGATPGELEVRGPFVADRYFKLPDRQAWTTDGWFRTGDIATIDAEGYIRITDRKKDLIKSGGEWISSIDMENALVAHPAVAEAAVVAVPDPKWQERPLALVVLKPTAVVNADELRSFLAGTFAKWQLPDDVVFVPELPHTSTGKLLKSELRQRFRNWHAENLVAPGA